MLNKRTVRRHVESQLIPHSFVFALGFPCLPPLQWKCHRSSCDLRFLTCWISAGISILRGTNERRDGNGSPLLFEVLRFTPSLILFGEEKSSVVQSWTPVASLRWNFFQRIFCSILYILIEIRKMLIQHCLVPVLLAKLANKTETRDLFTWNGKENTLVCF